MNNVSTNTLQQAHQTTKPTAFEFRGDGSEYFKIWIVNVILTIMTLGIYSAWAKVRNNRYFYSNLYLDDNNFRYLAEPIQILKGRLIAIVALIVYSVIMSLYPTVGIMLAITLVLSMPYFFNQSLSFNHRMSAYKNIQFRFNGNYRQAFMVMFVWPILGMLTLGILYPMALLKMNQYIVNNSCYGTSSFKFNASYQDYAVIFLTMVGVGLVIGLPAWAITAYVPALAFIAPVAMIIMYFGLVIYFLVAATNMFYCNLTLLEHEFEARLTMPELAKVVLTNTFLTVITLGLYLPAAKVRMTKYLCDNLVMHTDGSLNNFSAAERENVSAIGEEMGQVFDFT